jgi:hypothetical protein
LSILLAVLIGSLSLWLARDRKIAMVPQAPVTTAEAASDSSPVALAAGPRAADQERTPAPAPVATDVSQPLAPATPFALLKVLVVEATTRHPVVGAEVRAMYDDGVRGHTLDRVDRSRGKPFQILPSDKDGRVEIEMPANVASNVSANDPSGVFGYTDVEIPPLEKGVVHDVLLEVPMGRDLPFWLKLVDAQTHDPLPGVRVSAMKGDDKAEPATSDANGLALFLARSWQQSNIRIEAEGRSVRYVVTEPGHSRPESPLIVEIPRAATLRVRALDGAGAPLGSAAIELSAHTYDLYPSDSPPKFNYEPDLHWRALTDDDGRATIELLPALVHVEAKVDGRVRWTFPDPLVFQPGEVRDVEWKISSGCDVHGLVVDQLGAPAANQAIWLYKATQKTPILFESWYGRESVSSTTDDRGRFSFPHVSPGDWWVGPAAKDIRAKADPEGVAPLANLVVIADGQADADVTIRVDRGLFIRGHVLDASGNPASTIFVSAYDPDKHFSARVNEYDTGGTFMLGPLMAGNYKVVANGVGKARDSDAVVAQPGDADIELRLRVGGEISGRVLDPEGRGVAGWIHLTSDDPTFPLTMNASVGNDGAFALDGLAPGTIRISATTSNADIALVDPIVLGDGAKVENLVLHVVPGGRVRVRCEDPEKNVRISVMQRGLFAGVDYVSKGSKCELTAPIGQVVVQAKYSGDDPRVVERTVEVRAGETADVVFENGAH